jgi:peroxiredoxin
MRAAQDEWSVNGIGDIAPITLNNWFRMRAWGMFRR